MVVQLRLLFQIRSNICTLAHLDWVPCYETRYEPLMFSGGDILVPQFILGELSKRR